LLEHHGHALAADAAQLGLGAGDDVGGAAAVVDDDRPLTARSSVDLPEPDRPISTEISPAPTARVAPAQPTTTPVLSWISARPAPASSIDRAFALSLPNRMSTFVNSTATLIGASPRRCGPCGRG
jgi:hypothetical protein